MEHSLVASRTTARSSSDYNFTTTNTRGASGNKPRPPPRAIDLDFTQANRVKDNRTFTGGLLSNIRGLALAAHRSRCLSDPRRLEAHPTQSHAAPLGGFHSPSAACPSTGPEPCSRFPPSHAEFRAAIRHHKGSTAPGATGLTYNIVKGCPDPVMAKVHQLLSLAFSDPTPAWLQWGWLCPKPKDPKHGVTLDGLRSLMLLEVLRKLWVWILVRKSASVKPTRSANMASVKDAARTWRWWYI